MTIIIDYYCNKPIYEQIADQIKSEIHCGKVAVGSPLPSIRTLASDLKVSVITTKRVYETLEREGYIKTVPQRGSFVADTSLESFTNDIKREISRRVNEVISYAKSLGISKNDIREILESELDNYA